MKLVAHNLYRIRALGCLYAFHGRCEAEMQSVDDKVLIKYLT